MKEKTLYHGSYCKITQPKIILSTFNKDFGTGFYCTELYIQAERWANRFKTPVINSYIFIEDNSLHIQHFETMDEKWLDFIVSCRSGKQHRFDIVSGAMANDQVWNYIADFISGILTREQFWALAKFKHPTHQIAFCSSKALQCLEFLDYMDCIE